MGYNDIRAALGRGFSVTTLHEITRLGHELLDSDTSLVHPSAVYVVAATAQKLASFLDSQSADDAVAVVEAHIRPKMEAVLNAADRDAQTLMMTLDDLTRAYGEARSFLK